ncbi:hypothetical protein [Chengkuizengella sediminis]|uniref:hypothetical protein n=1 Tax=Chengkuizengella sediminis TaxID=1885917 RepID=UPI001389C6B0|nr:hypothetical protein [Chengkuizengella sediminis]NDI36699.1 hypothetical protein [Chengkuizengella sediminis]
MRWLIAYFCILISILLLSKGFSLPTVNSNHVDGSQIGIYFLGFEIKDKVPREYVPIYSAIFLMGSFMFATFSTLITMTSLLTLKRFK